MNLDSLVFNIFHKIEIMNAKFSNPLVSLSIEELNCKANFYFSFSRNKMNHNSQFSQLKVIVRLTLTILL